MLNKEQIQALAPDEASMSAGRGLAAIHHWPLLGADETALWGECKGSGKNPYRAALDRRQLAFKCSCPSRKIPCKHVLGLMLLHAEEIQYFADKSQPDWVEEWLTKRSAKGDSTETQPKSKNPSTADARQRKVRAGMEELQLFVSDLARNGLLSLQNSGSLAFAELGKRMVDAQAPGLAAIAFELEGTDYSSDSWTTELTDSLLRMYLLSEAFEHFQDKEGSLAEEIRSRIGFNKSKEELNAVLPVKDNWLLLFTEEDKQAHLYIRKHWFFGLRTGKKALFLQFFIKSQPPEFNPIQGAVYESEFRFYPGLTDQRVHATEFVLAPAQLNLQVHENLRSLWAEKQSHSLKSPFYDEDIFLISSVRLGSADQNWFLYDEEMKSLRISSDHYEVMKALAISGGEVFTAALLFRKGNWILKGVCCEGSYYKI